MLSMDELQISFRKIPKNSLMVNISPKALFSKITKAICIINIDIIFGIFTSDTLRIDKVHPRVTNFKSK